MNTSQVHRSVSEAATPSKSAMDTQSTTGRQSTAYASSYVEFPPFSGNEKPQAPIVKKLARKVKTSLFSVGGKVKNGFEAVLDFYAHSEQKWESEYRKARSVTSEDSSCDFVVVAADPVPEIELPKLLGGRNHSDDKNVSEDRKFSEDMNLSESSKRHQKTLGRRLHSYWKPIPARKSLHSAKISLTPSIAKPATIISPIPINRPEPYNQFSKPLYPSIPTIWRGHSLRYSDRLRLSRKRSPFAIEDDDDVYRQLTDQSWGHRHNYSCSDHSRTSDESPKKKSLGTRSMVKSEERELDLDYFLGCEYRKKRNGSVRKRRRGLEATTITTSPSSGLKTVVEEQQYHVSGGQVTAGRKRSRTSNEEDGGRALDCDGFEASGEMCLRHRPCVMDAMAASSL